MHCNFTDTCRIISSADELSKQYQGDGLVGNASKFPMILCNCNIHNSAAQLAHMTVKLLEINLGTDKTNRILRHILLDDSFSALGNLVLILKALRGEVDFVVEFLDLFQTNAMLSDEERATSQNLQMQSMAADQYLGKMLKSATPQVNKQWSQWSMLMGLIEKQLAPMRGSMWPATELVKPHEDKLRKMIREDAAKKGKNQSNFEEMLEVARDMYNHNAVEPGKLIEQMLKDVRVWNH